MKVTPTEALEALGMMLDPGSGACDDVLRRFIAENTPRETTVAYCHECGHVGPIPSTALACCPDNMPRQVRPETARQAALGFALGILGDLPRQLAAAKREVAMRRRVYPRRVAEGKMPEAHAAGELDAMLAIEATLERLAKADASTKRPELF